MFTWYKKTLFAVLPFVGTLCMAPIVSADHSEWRSGYDDSQMSSSDLRSFEDYLNSHWETAQLLYQNPDLLKNHRFVRDHAALHDWLEAHADAAEELRANPHKYLWRENAYRADEDRPRHARMTERELRSFESFLDENPETARRLYENPDLINDRQFVRDRESLDSWMDNHPDAAYALRANPQKFLWRERTTSPADFLSQLFHR